VSDIPDRIHKTLIQTIVKGLSNRPVVLKGSTALMLVYGLAVCRTWGLYRGITDAML
jgi:hypothetical protein